MLNRRHFVASIALASFANPAAAADWPQRPVRIIGPYSAGDSGDTTARLIARLLSEKFGQSFIVENHVGANGTIAVEAVARSPADGYTLLWAVTPPLVISPAMMKVPYDTVKDFSPISAVSLNRFALVVNEKVPVKTVAEFIEFVRAQGNSFAYAEGSAGSISHLAMVLFLERAGLSGTNVSYRGLQPALLDVFAGHLPAVFALLGDARSQSESGAVRMLAVTSAQRSPQAPDVPTMAESGFPGFSATSWWGLMAPAGTPPPIVNRLAMEVSRATKDPQVIEQFTKFSIDPLGTSPAEFATMISSDIQLWAKAVKIAAWSSR